MIGSTVGGRYEVLRQLGVGGMGAVYEARHTGTGRRVALKVILGEAYLQDEGLFARFRREARAAGQIDTQHIVQVLDSGVDEGTGTPFMVMELLRGEDAEQFVKRVGPLAPDLAIRLVGQACLGLQKAHEAGVIHRDIKPANLFLHRDGLGGVTIKLLDFGIAKVSQDQLSATNKQGLTRTGSLLGTPLFMSPEQAMGQKSIDHRTDIWSIGVVLYYLLAGRTPHEDADTIGKLIFAICSDPPAPIQDIAPWVDPDLANILQNMLRLVPDKRFAKASELADALRPLSAWNFAITELSLVGITDEQRAHVAVRADIMPSGKDGEIAANSLLTTPPTAAMAASASSTQAGLGKTLGSSAPKRKSLLFALGIAVALLAAGTFGAVMVVNTKPPQPVAGAVVSIPATPATIAAPPAAESASAATELAAKPPEVRHARVLVRATNATVEVDGHPVSLVDGGADIAGTLGSVHPVRVTAYGRVVTTDVVLSEGGAVPPVVEGPVAAGKPASEGKGAAASTKTPEAKPPKSRADGLDGTFQ